MRPLSTRLAHRRRAAPPPPRALRHLLAGIGALFVVIAAVLLPAASASAHAVLVRSSPVDGTSVEHAPTTVSLTFDERVQLVPGSARVISATGVRADTGDGHTTAAGDQVRIPLRHGLRDGSYIVTWRVVSADTHIVAGSITFGIGAPAGVAAVSAAGPTSLDVVATAAQGLSYAGVVLAFGVAAIGAILWPSTLRARRSRALRTVGLAALIIGAVVELFLQGPRAAATGWPGVLRLDGIGLTVGSVFGLGLIARIAVLIVAGPVLLGRLGASGRPGRRGRVAAARITALTTALAVLVSIALDGHAGVGSGAWLAVPAAVLHLAAMSVWLGGITVIGVVLLPRLRGPHRAPGHSIIVQSLRSWSSLAFLAIAVLIVTGEYQAWRVVQPLPALWTTGYGITLLVKLGFVALAVAAAAIPQRILLRTRRTATDAPILLRTVRRSLIIEATCTALVVATTAVLTALPPATTTYGPALSTAIPIGSDRLAVNLSGTHHGPTTMTARLESRTGQPVTPDSIEATLASPTNGVAAIAVPLHREPDGSFRSTSMTIPLSGRWTITFDVSVTSAFGAAAQTSFTAW
ncbi:copper resistance CopC/CopD family protein [Curtobacterium ammoniigenes]|uniref:copper resistance CopC/CopD family protein n=1 Tax=Curtobacterium ammoniigenes TaxID=395387 RepID=UPI000830B64B|nr:FixH family protein [Curtobacterium ammoniigenes]